MKTTWVLLASCAALYGCALGEPRRVVAEAVLDGWSSVSRVEGRRALERYGPPDEIEAGRLAWRDRAPFKRIVVWDQEPIYVSDGLDALILHSVRYEVPAGRRELLERFSDKLIIDPGSGELAVRSGSEETNLLLLNLADDLAMGRRDLPEARQYMMSTVRASASGRSSPYLEGLLFNP